MIHRPRRWLPLLLAVCAAALADTPVRPLLVGIYTPDFETTVRWYADNFGFETTREVTNDAANVRIAILDNGAFELEIYADLVPDDAIERLRRDRFGMPTEGFVKLTVETDDLASLSDSLRDNDVEFVREINTSDRKAGYSWFMVADPDGNLVQVFGPSP